MNPQGLTFRELITRVAEVVGTATQPSAGEAIAPPTNTRDLDQIKRAINDGLTVLVNSNVNQWNCLRVNFTATFKADGTDPRQLPGQPQTYLLPFNVDAIPEARFWATSGTRTACLQVRDQSFVQSMNAAFTATGEPQYAALMVLTPQATTGERRLAMTIHPRPNVDWTVVGQATLVPGELIADTDRSPMGARHDQALLAQALCVIRRAHPDASIRAACQAEADRLTALSIEADKHLAPRELGPTIDPLLAAVGSKADGPYFIGEITGLPS